MITTEAAILTDTSDCPIWSHESFIPEVWCKEIIEHCGKDMFTSGTTGDSGLRFSDQVYFENDQLMQRIGLAVRTYARERNIDIGDGNHLETLSLVRYVAGGKYDWHMDNEMTRPENRKVAVVIALNEDFEGGGTQWMWPHPAAMCHSQPKTGSIAVFPSVLLHRGMPVTSGERWIIVTWAFGPQWR